MSGQKNIKVIFIAITTLFAAFLLVPMIMIFGTSFGIDGGFSLQHYASLFEGGKIIEAFVNSVSISSLSGVIATIIAFLMAYAINYTNLWRKYKYMVGGITILPMLLPTITYGFAIIYSFGKQGLLTMLFGEQYFEIYGVTGLVLGYVIYTLPVSFLLINNTMGYVDKKFMIVSRAMGDRPFKSFMSTVIRPLWGTLAAAFIQSFALCFTDYGIPASLSGNLNLVSTFLYQEMLGSLPDLGAGSAIAILMLIPSVVSIALLTYLNKFNIRYTKISLIEVKKNKIRDGIFAGFSVVVMISILMIFAVILIVPFVEQWPYKPTFTLEHVLSVFQDSAIIGTYGNSLLVAFATAFFGTLIVYAAALIAARGYKVKFSEKVLDGIALVSNTIPGMVIGVAFLLTFTGTPLQNTIGIIVISNIVHFFSSPYLIMKSGLEKLNASWETTAKLMGDTWLKTVIRVITPNAIASLLEVFKYYFVNAMVTISAVIFIAGARTMVVTAKIKELQHFSNYNEIFVLSILILVTNLVIKGVVQLFIDKYNKKI